ncbi:MAG TPA: glutamate 5-kinase [Myxococcota bacterium]
MTTAPTSSTTKLHPSRHRLTTSRRVVVKIGSALLKSTTRDPFAHFASEVMALRRTQRDVVVVSSGAIALGLSAMGITVRPTDLPTLQAAAACGQSRLMNHWAKAFAWFGVEVAQVLLTHDDLKDRRRWKNARQALSVLLERGIVPIINENDTVGVAEIKLGDNDTLAAATAGLVDADTVVLLTGAPGLFTADPGKDPLATRLPVVDAVTDEVRALAGGADLHGTGGMITKLEAATVARRHGAQTVIAPGKDPGVLDAIFRGDDIGTVVSASAADRGRERNRWIGTLKSRGTIVVDDGAAGALRKNASLLFAGVVAVAGDFEAGDVVTIVDKAGVTIARGLVAVDDAIARRVMGRKTAEARSVVAELPDELVHRDELVFDHA